MNAFLDLTKMPAAQVLSNFTRIVKSERKIMHIVLSYIAEVDRRKLYLEANCDSLYKFLTQVHGYAENAAYDRMAAARVVRAVPEVALKIEEGTLNLSQLVKVNQCIKQVQEDGEIVRPEKTEEILSMIENKTIYQTEKVLACEFNFKPKAHQKIKPQADNTVRVELTFTEEEMELIKEALALNSHIVYDNNLAKLFVHFAKKEIQKRKGKEPTNKHSDKNTDFSTSGIDKENKCMKSDTPSNPDKEIKSSASETQTRKTPTQRFGEKRKCNRKYFPIKKRRIVFTRAEYGCQHVHPEIGERCKSNYQLQVDHIIPVAKGGTDDLENLRALCGIHNRAEAERMGLRRRRVH